MRQSPSSLTSAQNLDIQYTVGIATGVPVTFISVGNDFHDGDLGGFLDIINFMLGESNPPQVLTTSYGDDESAVSRALTKCVFQLSSAVEVLTICALIATCATPMHSSVLAGRPSSLRPATAASLA